MLFLASTSPRRIELLKTCGYTFEQLGIDIDETPFTAEEPLQYVERMAVDKAQAGWNALIAEQRQSAFVLGSDTCGVLDGEILLKPENESHSAQMLQKLSGKTHLIFTSIAVMSARGIVSQVITSEVTFKVLTHHEITDYWATGEPQGKAGSYAIQGLGAKFVRKVNGSYTGVVGLPLVETQELLTQAGYSL